MNKVVMNLFCCASIALQATGIPEPTCGLITISRREPGLVSDSRSWIAQDAASCIGGSVAVLADIGDHAHYVTSIVELLAGTLQQSVGDVSVSSLAMLAKSVLVKMRARERLAVGEVLVALAYGESGMVARISPEPEGEALVITTYPWQKSVHKLSNKQGHLELM